MTSVGTPLLWGTFLALVLVMLVVDLVVVNKNAHEVKLREAALWSAVWVLLSLAFNGWVWFHLGGKAGMEFLAGYLLEKALSVDNLFVFLLVLTNFRVPKENQHWVLFWGVLGALVLRVLFILAGTALIQRFHWIMYGFGAFLVYTGIKLLLAKDGDEEEEKDLSGHPVLRAVRRVVPMSEGYDGARFFTRASGRWMATPMLAVLAVVETTDLVFALDSIPAVFGVTTDPFLVFTSNICAVLGLRALYFLIMGVLQMFRYLKLGLGLVLAFIGAKMLAEEYFHVPIGWSLATIAAILGLTILASVVAQKREAR